MFKLFFVCDVHGSDMVFRKFLNAVRVYGVNVAIMAGDLSGKLIIPIVRETNSIYKCLFLDEEITATNEDELQNLEKRISLTGSYPYRTTPDELKELASEGKTVKGRMDARKIKIKIGTGKIEDLFEQLVLARLKNWVKLAEERLTNSGVELFISPGNDDIVKIEEVLTGSRHIVCAADSKVNVKDHEMVSLSYSNPTPWETPRECGEEELARKIDSLVCGITDMEKAIFNFHIPPYGTMLDIAPKISDDLTMSGSETSNVGSTAVLDAIKRYQPLLGLHGHIHESKAIQKVGRTTCVNPGSEYTEGTLKGVIITIDDGKIKNHMFTSG